jgi:hypothetical protein
MKFIHYGVIDLGISFGIDDSYFIKNRNWQHSGFATKYKTSLLREEEEYKFLDINFPVGKGLRINLSGDEEIMDDLLGNIRKKLPVVCSYKEGEDITLSIINNSKITQFTIDIYSIGFAFLRIDFEVDDFNPDFLYEIYASIGNEDGIYDGLAGIYSVLSEFIKALKEYDSLETNRVYQLIKRNKADRIRLNNMAFIVIEKPKKKFKSLLKQVNLSIWQTEKRIEFEGVDLHYGWHASAIKGEASDTFSVERIMILIQLATTYNYIAVGLENFLDNELSELVRSNMENAVSEKRILELNKIRTYITSAISLTDFSSTCIEDISNISFFEKFNKITRIEKKQENILKTCEVFVGIQNEFMRIEDTKRQNRLNNFVFYLTSLTFVSVLADIISTTDFANNLITSSILRFLILAIPTLLVIFVIRKILMGTK